MKAKDHPTPELLNDMLKRVQGGSLEALINTMLLRSLKRAEYRAENIGHSGLALDYYLHFTSPIRRYPDLVVHRLLKRLLKGGKGVGMSEWGEQFYPELQGRLSIMAKRASDCEQVATDAERENDHWKSCLLMKPKIGQKFKGTIQGFSQKAAFVRLDSPFVEVGVPLGSLGGEFHVDEYRTKATGMGGQVELPIGTKVLAEITSIDENLRRVSAWITEATVRDSRGKTVTFTPTLLGPASLREQDFVEPKRGRQREPRERGGARPSEGRPQRGSGARPKQSASGKVGKDLRKPKPPKGSVRVRRGR
jgi:ribonuclease R